MEVPKKILYVVTKANWGGAQRYVFDLATHLPEGYEPAVAYGQPGLLAQRLKEAGIRTYPLQSLQRDISAWADIKSFFELYRLVLKVNPDVVHLNSSKAGAVGALAAWCAGAKRIVFTAHGWPFNERRGKAARALIWLASWITALLSDKIIAVSDSELLAAKRMPLCGSKAVRIYNGIDLSMQFGSGEAIRAAFPAGARIVGTVGELTRNKNQIELIERARKDTSMRVAIVGEGELRPMLEQKIKEYGLQERVKLFGFMPASEVLRGFDAFALPSLKEGLGYVILEARAAGLPIEASRVGGTPEALEKDLGEFSLDRMVGQTINTYRS